MTHRTLIKAASLLSMAALTTTAFATDGKWNADAGDNWSVATRWTNSQIADGIDAVANISFNITAARTLTLDSARTVGRLRFEDASTASHDWTFSASSANPVLTLQTSSGSPVIEIANRTANFNTVLQGTQGFTKTGGGLLVLNATTNYLLGKIVFSAGDTRVRTAGTLGGDPGSYVADQITINNAAMMNNDSGLILSPNQGVTIGSSGANLQAGWSKPITINAPIVGTGSLTIRNDSTPGLITLNGANSYTGATYVGNASSSGTTWAWLIVNGELPSSSVLVRYNASLGGTGPIDGPVATTTNGIISPGGVFQPGTLTCTNTVSLTNATLNFDLADVTTEGGGVNDLLQVGGDLTLQGTITVEINPLGGKLANGTYRLINYAGSLTLSDATLVCSNPRYGATFDTSTPGQINITIATGELPNLVWLGSGGFNWDVAFTTNFLNNGTPDKFYQGDSVTFDDTGFYTNAATIGLAAPLASMATILPGSVRVNTTNNLTLAGTWSSARLGGSMSLYKSGSGTLTWQQANNNQPNMYEGLTVVTDGTLKLGNWRVLGDTNAGSGTIVTNLGRIDLNGQAPIYDSILAQGSGPDGSGAIYNGGGGLVNEGLRGEVTLAGDTTFGGSGRWDVFGGKLIANGHKITKTGGNEIALSNLGDTGMGDMEINQGVLTYLGTTLPGPADGTITVVSNAYLNFWALNNSPSAPFTKKVALEGGIMQNASGVTYVAGETSLEGTNTFNSGGGSGALLSVLGPVTGSGTLRKTGTYPLYLEGTNTYTGPTLVTAGTLTVGFNGSISNSSLIALSSGTTLDVLQVPGAFTLNGGQTLAGSGTVQGNITVPDGAAIVPGSSIGTLAISGQLSLSNAATTFELGPSSAAGNDLISVGSLAASGVTAIKVVPLATLDTSAPYNLFQVNGGLLPSGTETNFSISSDSRYSFTLLPVDSPSSANVFLQAQVTGTGTAAALSWAGNDPTNPTWWDERTTTNWSNAGTPDAFYVADSVVFDDTATGTAVELIGTLKPSFVQLKNAAKTFTIGGAGSIVTPSLSDDGSGTTTLANSTGNSFLYGITNNSGTLVIGNGADNNYGPGLTLNGGTVVFDQTFPVTLGVPVSGAGQLTKAGTNTLTLSTANSAFIGNVQVNDGTLRVANASALGTTAGTTTIANGGALDVNAQGLGFEPVIASGAGPDGMGAIVNRSGTQQQNALRKVTLAGDAAFGAINARWDIRSDVYANPNATLSSSGNAYKLTKLGPFETWIVSTTVDPALGDIDVVQGTLGYEAVTTGLGNPANTLTIYPGATLGFYNTINPLNKRITLQGGGRIYASNGPSNVLSGPITVPSGMGIIEVTSGVTLAATNQISGDGGLTKLNTGTAVLIASNSFAGTVAHNSGTLTLSNSYALGTNKLVAVTYNTATAGGNGTRLSLRGGLTMPEDLVGLFTAITNTGDYRCSISSDSLANTWAGPILLNGNNVVGFYGTASTPLTLTGPITGTNGYTGTAFFRGGAGFCGTVSGTLNAPSGVMAITDNSVWRFNSPNNVWYRTLIAYGRMILGTDNAAPTTAELVLGQSGSSSGTLDLNGFSQTVPSVSTVNGSTHYITNSSSTADSLFTYDGGVTVSTLDGKIVDGPRKVAVTVKSGTLTLLGANTYTGPTIISGGTLGLGSAAAIVTPLIDLRAGGTLDTGAKPALVLASGQTLVGDGTVRGSITFGSGATLSPGASIGALTVNNTLTLQTGSTNVFELDKSATPASDLVNAATVVFGGTLVLNNLGPALAAGDSFKLFNATAYSGSFTAVSPAKPATGLLWDLTKLAVDGTISVKLDIPTTPTNITAAVSGNTLTLSWPSEYTGWRLEAQTNALNIGISTNWVLVPESTTTNQMSFTIDPNQPTVFYRLGITTP